MKAVVFFSMTKKQSCKNIANEIDGDHFEIVNLHKPVKFVVFKLLYYGFIAIAKKKVKIQSPEIDFDKYDEVVLVSPVWAGKVCAYMAEFLRENQFMNKDVIIISSSIGENNNYLKSVEVLIDKSNKVINYITYINGIKTDERKV